MKENDNPSITNELDFASTQNASLIEKRNQQIVDGALRVFLEKGYHPTTIREIAKACNMSIGQLYHYISSKDDVLYLAHKHMQMLWYEYLKKSEMEKIEDPIEKLNRALHYSLIFMLENRKLVRFVYTESKYLDEKYLKTVLDLDQKNIIGFWQNILKEVNKISPIPGDLDFHGSIMAYLIAFLALRGWTLKGYTKENQRAYLVDFALRGLGVATIELKENIYHV